VSDPFDSLHLSYSDYDSYRGPPSTGIHIPGPTTASGVLPNVNDVLPPGVTAFDYLFPTRHSATPELQYPAEDVLWAITPPPRSNSLGFQSTERPDGPFLSPLVTLAHVASITCPASAPPTPHNEDTHLFALASPTSFEYPDPLNVAQSQEEEAPTEFTFGPPSRSASPSYHVRSPSPRSPISRMLSPFSFSPLPVSTSRPLPRVPSPPPPSLEQENHQPPLVCISTPPLDPYLPPHCISHPSPVHPHQYFIIELDNRQIWCPVSEGEVVSFLSFPTHEELIQYTTVFPTVTPFKGYTPHATLVNPANQWQATLFDIPSIYTCCHAGFALPSPGAPLGYVIFTFHLFIKETFLRHSALVCNVFKGSLVVTEVYDFLNGRRVYVYGHLSFGQDSVYVVNPAYHFEDAVARYPALLRHCVTPRIPADPCFFVQVYPDDTPL
jgi:hypothetical protein